MASLPAEQHLGGIDLCGVLEGGPPPARTEFMIWDFNGYGGQVAIRDGRWKAIRRNLLQQPTPWELDDINRDRSKSNDLANTYPDCRAAT